MMAPPICGRENQDVREAAALMQRWRLYGLPVVNRGLQLAGVVFLRDLRGMSAASIGRHRARTDGSESSQHGNEPDDSRTKRDRCFLDRAPGTLIF